MNDLFTIKEITEKLQLIDVAIDVREHKTRECVMWSGEISEYDEESGWNSVVREESYKSPEDAANLAYQKWLSMRGSKTNLHTRYEEFRELSLALEIATKAHAGQVDKAGHPYIAHPVIVASMVDETIEKVVALLHDVVEDSDMTIEDLRKVGFSENTLDAVQAITKVEGESYSDYLARVAANPIAREVKIVDMQHNSDLSRIPYPTEKDLERVEKYKVSIEKLNQG